MFFEPQLMGKEPMLRIPEGSSSKDLSLGQFRETLWAQAKNLDPWELLPQFFLELIKETQLLNFWKSYQLSCRRHESISQGSTES